MECHVCEPARFLVHFSGTFPYHPNFEPILDWFAGFVSIPLCECNLSPIGLLERTGAYQLKIAFMAIANVQGFTSRIFRAVDHLRENLDFFSPLGFDVKTNSDHKA